MRIAVSGTHRTGKTSLVEALAGVLPGYAVREEPYRLLEEDGYEFADPPTVEDFERQLELSREILASAPANVLLDRCSLDFIAYMQAKGEDVDVDDLRDEIASLDLIVVVPIETPDRIALPAHEDRRLRRLVDEHLRRLVVDDPHGFEANVLEVSGGLEDRIRQVTRAMQNAK